MAKAFVGRKRGQPVGKAFVIPQRRRLHWMSMGGKIDRVATDEEAQHVVARPLPIAWVHKQIEKARAEAEAKRPRKRVRKCKDASE